MSEVKSLARGLFVIDELIRLHHDGTAKLTVTALAQQLSINKSSASRILKTIADNGYAKRAEGSRAYVLGDKLRNTVSSLHDNMAEISTPFLSQLVGATQECAHVAVHSHNKVLFLQDIEPEQMLRVSNSKGRTEHMYCTAVGKTLLAFQHLPISERLTKRTEKTLTSVAALEQHLEQIRQQGYALDDEENYEGVRCIASPVYNAQGLCIACMGISGPSVRMHDAKLEQLSQHVIDIAQSFSHYLGYSPT